jgi:hypothetical protein
MTEIWQSLFDALMQGVERRVDEQGWQKSAQITIGQSIENRINFRNRLESILKKSSR